LHGTSADYPEYCRNRSRRPHRHWLQDSPSVTDSRCLANRSQLVRQRMVVHVSQLADARLFEVRFLPDAVGRRWTVTGGGFRARWI